MKEIKIGKHKIKVYDSIEELPVVRHHKFNKLMLIDAHVGSDISDFDSHIERVMRYLSVGKNDLAEKELMVLRQNVFFIQSETSPRSLAFASLIYSIDGEIVDDFSDEALRELADRISDITVGELNDTVNRSKKKLDEELQVYFPSLFEDSSIKEYYDRLKKRTLLAIKKLTGELTTEESKEFEDLTTELILFYDPQVFAGPNSIEVKQDKQFEDACLAIAQSTNTDPKKFTVLEYYNALFFLEKQAKTQSKKNRKK